jgi:hypothetical protein
MKIKSSDYDMVDSESETRKWLINRIEYNIQSSIDELQLDKEQVVRELTDAYPSDIVNKRNIILAVVGFLATLIPTIAGFDEMVPIRIFLMQVLIIVLVIGGGVFIIFSWIRRELSTKIERIELAYLALMNNLNFLKGFVANHSLFIEPLVTNLRPLDPDQLLRLSDYVILIKGNKVELSRAFREASTSILFQNSKYHDRLNQQIKKQESEMDMLCDHFYDEKENFIKPTLFKDIKHLIEPLFDRCNKKKQVSDIIMPIEITMIAALMIVGGIILLLGGIAVMIPFAPLLSNDIDTNTSSTSLQIFTGILEVVGACLLVLASGTFIVALGLFKGKEWTWIGTFVISIIAIVLSGILLGIIFGATWIINTEDVLDIIMGIIIFIANIIAGIIINAIILYYLYKPYVKAYFATITSTITT